MKLIDKYLTSDYSDIVSKKIHLTKPLSSNIIFEKMFCDFPKPVVLLMKIRNKLMKPFGLKTGESFRDLITEKNEEEILICKNNKHLCFWVSIYCSLPADGWQNASVTTIVKFNNVLGKIYFIGIWIFHKLLVISLFSKATSKNE